MFREEADLLFKKHPGFELLGTPFTTNITIT